jgi:predicted P-loop ATPase
MARPPRVVPLRTGWQGMVRRNATGNIIADLRNTLIILRQEMGFAACFAFDEMQQATMVLDKPLICHDALHGAETPRFADPEDVTRLQEWLQHNAMPKLARDHVEHALEEFARERPIHPLRDRLAFLEWDGEPRIGRFLHHALGTPDDEYHRQIGAMFLIAMVARVFKPGCQADYMLVLEGPQGEEKSKFCRALAGDEYFSDALPRLEGDMVRVSMHLRGKWLIEISELSAFSKSEAGALKAFITRREEIYTPKYGRKERREPRQGLFIGTTNDDEYIRDDTGGRRFWPVRVVKVDLEWLSEHRDQLFAEAVSDFHHNKPHWPDRDFERTTIAPLQSGRQVFDNWTDRVLEIAGLLQTVTIAAVWQGLGSISHGGDLTRLGMVEQRRIGAILKLNGYRKGQNHEGRTVWRKQQGQTLQTVADPVDY